MPEHKAVLSCVNFELPRAVNRQNYLRKDCQGVTIKIYSDSVFLGALLVGQGGIGWRGSKKRLRKLTWTEFSDTMQNRLQNRAR